ncbi:hypothetical protein [Rhodanobacter sp. MP7CTX1]|uniref:hypothetical protein n=1 Tax=Rhodanobacter sp. MP7CTX1 TaxID=2723084 RepID=UPI00161DFB7A|nr:hypothetical protein [Rhodanobacter sp. MP7CTX1]MBB6187695.1 HEAT repeat protein [Rhodanobacter sp. MP7CTX1]
MDINFETLAHASIALGQRPVIMPIEEMQIASAFAELPDRVEVVTRLVHELFNNENMHVRRIAVNACRRAKTFEVAGLEHALTERLTDPEPWVRYDAIWAIQDAGYDSPEIRARLAAIVENSTSDDEAYVRKSPNNAVVQARVRAQRLLAALA